MDEAGILAGNRLLHQMFENALRALCDAELPVTADDIEKICQRDGYAVGKIEYFVRV